ncbi:hypothetical protein SADUNF_Sadunf14G0088400 [Salix dunnii]|uniref:Uncharacterized protein n=1 Tax=Salix dunnii TaxID=1413687 RepID=A0A835JH01_9ROSI|nr:hypothetical protein SADUNF_Sadunf14G0088400 [Salix dunnii]
MVILHLAQERRPYTFQDMKLRHQAFESVCTCREYGNKGCAFVGESGDDGEETGCGEETGDGDGEDSAGPRQSGLALFPALQGTQMTSEKNERREGIRRKRMDLSSSIIFSGRRGEMERENDGGS